MVGDKVSLLLSRQRHEALKALGYYKGDVGAMWGAASTDALRAAQTALGIGVDGKWGPETEDAIQQALAERQGCTADECHTEGGPALGGTSTDALAAIGRLGWWIVGGTTVAGVALGMMLVARARH